ncbi:MAG: hypothetical protein J6A19_13870 [Oscillospiraceae bacterium]|nr:hypothetical protein [Oscillospiraceae bacterium]
MSRKNEHFSKSLLILVIMLLFFLVLTVLFYVLYRSTLIGCFYSLFVTALTFLYHFVMRVAVGECVTLIYAKREFHYSARWYQQNRFEKAVYKLLRIKRWKSKAITAKPWQFDIKNRTYEELLHNMTQAEIVHEIIMVLSFVPIGFTYWFGAGVVFVITSVAACCIDLYFVMIQRYNRPRVLALKKAMERRRGD